MDDSTKIAIGVVAAAFVLVFGFVGYHEYERQRDQDEARQLLARMAVQGQQVVQQYQDGLLRARADVQRQLAAQTDASLRDRLRYALAGDQRCVNGTVVQVDGSTYTQLGSIQYPIHCDGSYADRPLR
jgi:hypothetical protein